MKLKVILIPDHISNTFYWNVWSIMMQNSTGKSLFSRLLKIALLCVRQYCNKFISSLLAGYRKRDLTGVGSVTGFVFVLVFLRLSTWSVHDAGLQEVVRPTELILRPSKFQHHPQHFHQGHPFGFELLGLRLVLLQLWWMFVCVNILSLFLLIYIYGEQKGAAKWDLATWKFNLQQA